MADFQIKKSSKEYEVCIVGSGAGGGMAAYVLSKAGLKVILLEAGPMYDPAKNVTQLKWPWESPRRGAGTPQRNFGDFDAAYDAEYRGDHATAIERYSRYIDAYPDRPAAFGIAMRDGRIALVTVEKPGHTPWLDLPGGARSVVKLPPRCANSSAYAEAAQRDRHLMMPRCGLFKAADPSVSVRLPRAPSGANHATRKLNYLGANLC